MLVLFRALCLEETYSLRDTLGNDGNGSDLRKLHQFHRRAVDGSGGGEVDDCVDIAVLGESLFDILVDREQGLASSPVPLRQLEFNTVKQKIICAHILLTN